MCLITDTMREGKEKRHNLLGRPERPKPVSGDPTVLDYALIKSGNQHYPSSELIRTAFKAAEQEDWIALSDLIDNWSRYTGETLSVLQWQRILQVLADTPVFLRYFDKYKTAGHEPGVAVYTCMMLWLIRQKRYNGLTACFESIREPTQSAYKTYLGGLLRSDDDALLGRAKDTLLRMIKENVRLVDTLTCSFLVRKMTGDFKGCKQILVAMQEAKIPLDESIVYSVLRSVRSEEEYHWLLEKIHGANLMTSSTLSAVLSSPWSQCESFNLPVVLGTLKDLLISPSSNLVRSLVHFCADSDTRMLQLFAHEWPDVDRRALSLALYQSKLVRGMQRPGPLEVAEHLIGLSLTDPPDAEKTEIASELAIQILDGYSRCSFELASKLSERLLFHGKAQLAADFILLFLERTKSTVSTGTCNMILKRVHEHGLHDLGERITVALMQMRVPGLMPSVRYGQSLFMSWFPVPDAASEEIHDAPHLVSTVKSLCKQGKLQEALQVIEQFEDQQLDEADERVVVLSKLGILTKMSGEREMYLATLGRIKELYEGPFKALCDYGTAIATGGKPGKTLSLRSGGPAENLRSLANIILQNAVAYRSFRTAKQVKEQLFSQDAIKPDLSTYKIYTYLMISHAHDRHEHGLPLPTELLEEILHAGLSPDMDAYSLLLEYAAALEDFDQVSNVLAHLMERGIPNRRIFDRLFAWMQNKGDLQSCLDLYEMMAGRCGVMPSTTAHNTIVVKCLEANDLSGAREWLLKAATKLPSGSILESRCSEHVVSQYFDQFYRVNSLSACQTELDALFRVGYHVPGDFYLAFFDDAMGRKNVRSARRYLNRLIYQKNPPPAGSFLDLCELLVLGGWIDDAHKVFSAIKSSQPEGWRDVPWKTFESYLTTKLPEMLVRQPALLERLRPPKPGQSCYSAKYVLDHVLREKGPAPVLSERWCQSVLANLIARGEFGLAGEFGMYMLTKEMSYGNGMAEEVCGQWSALRAIVKPAPRLDSIF